MPKISKHPIPAFLSIKAIAGRLDVSTRTVQRWIEQGDLAAYKFGGALRVSEGDLHQFIARARHRNGPDDLT